MDFAPAGPIVGEVTVPGDKSISHRALMIAAMARGRSVIEGLSQGEDVLATASALRALGVGIEAAGTLCEVQGVGPGCLLQPWAALDMGNSGTSARLLMGLLASHAVTATLVGDASLSRRPMRHVIAPLERIGAKILCAPGGRLPLTLSGASPALPLEHRLPAPSAQLKSALLLAALNVDGVTRIVEPVATRDHSERMLRLFGADLHAEEVAGERHILLRGGAPMAPTRLGIAGDPSAAAFLAVAALIVPGSELRIEGIGINPTRMGLFAMLRQMGADLSFSGERDLDGEPVADLVVRHSALRGIDVPPEIAPSMVDEFPIFFVAAAFASGVSRTRGLDVLRVKESDRIGSMSRGLRAIGAGVTEKDEGLIIDGSGGKPLAGGATIASRLDHRVAMSFAVAGLHCREPVTVDDMRTVDTSFPGFAGLLAGLSRHGERGR